MKSEPVKTVLVITVGMLVVYLITKWKWALNVSLIVGVMGILSAGLAKKINYLWMKLAWLLSLIVPNILLSIIFYFFLTPIAFLSKIFGDKNPLFMKNKTVTLFKDYNRKLDKSYFEKPW